MKIIISFCAECGCQLRAGEENCGNCNHSVVQRNQRLEGTFDEADGNRLLVLIGDEPIIGSSS